jgi:hypothetical protein
MPLIYQIILGIIVYSLISIATSLCDKISSRN